MRRTRIITTLGPASDQTEQIAALIAAGTDVFRLNFSHGTIDTHAAVCGRVREAAARSGRPIAIMQDLAGPKIRIGRLETPLALSAGDPFTIVFANSERQPSAGAVVTTSFRALFRSVAPGTRLLVDEGRIELEVMSAEPDRLETRVITGGLLDSHKGINLPGAMLQASALTPVDEENLRAGVGMGVDIVAVSFVQSAEDMRKARAAASAAGAPDVPLIAKIEKPLAVDRIESILEHSDGLMVARGDLGIEMPLESVPAVQKRLVLAAREHGLPVIVATQVLESMRTAPRPTRAEVTDAAHAVDEGADAVMLAGETAIGQYPMQAVQTLDRILREAEREPAPVVAFAHDRARWSAHGRALCEAAVALAARVGAAAIVAVTEAGRTARMLSALRPRAPIIAAASDPSIAARLNLMWGVFPLVAPPQLADLRRLLVDRDLVPRSSPVVFVSMGPELGRTETNFVHVETL